MHGVVQGAPARLGGRDNGTALGQALGGGTVRRPREGQRQVGGAVARHRHTDVGPVRHAGEEHPPGELAERRDAHQAGPVQRARRGQTTARDQGE